MDRLLWQRVEPALQEAVALEPASRAQYIAAISDPEVRVEVESMVAADSERLEQSLGKAISGTASRIIDGVHAFHSHFSHYRLLELLGSGGTSQVYLAEDLRLGRKTALKFLPAAFSDDKARVRRFEREARAASAANHPNIATIYEIGTVEDQWFIAMEYVPGEPLTARISRGPMAVPEALEIAEQAAEALSETHQHGILHGDIKPANIMLRTDGVVKLVDFGIARLDPVLFDGSQTTYSGRLLGTPAYMSPEQAKGHALSAGSDLWSLGAVLYEMVTGTRAFRGSETPEVLVAILARRPIAPSKKLATIPPAVDFLIMKLLSQNSAARYSSAREVQLALREVRAGLQFGLVRKSLRWISSIFHRSG